MKNRPKLIRFRKEDQQDEKSSKYVGFVNEQKDTNQKNRKTQKIQQKNEREKPQEKLKLDQFKSLKKTQIQDQAEQKSKQPNQSYEKFGVDLQFSDNDQLPSSSLKKKKQTVNISMPKGYKPQESLQSMRKSLLNDLKKKQADLSIQQIFSLATTREVMGIIPPEMRTIYVQQIQSHHKVQFPVQLPQKNTQSQNGRQNNQKHFQKNQKEQNKPTNIFQKERSFYAKNVQKNHFNFQNMQQQSEKYIKHPKFISNEQNSLLDMSSSQQDQNQMVKNRIYQNQYGVPSYLINPPKFEGFQQESSDEEMFPYAGQQKRVISNFQFERNQQANFLSRNQNNFIAEEKQYSFQVQDGPIKSKNNNMIDSRNNNLHNNRNEDMQNRGSNNMPFCQQDYYNAHQNGQNFSSLAHMNAPPRFLQQPRNFELAPQQLAPNLNMPQPRPPLFPSQLPDPSFALPSKSTIPNIKHPKLFQNTTNHLQKRY